MKSTVNSKGLTLIEVVVASLLLVSALAPIFTLMHSCLNSFHSAGDRSQLVAAGKAVMEESLTSSNLSIGEQNGLSYFENPKIKYDMLISNYQDSYVMRSIEIKIYEIDYPEKPIFFNTVRVRR
ncbi:MAG: hypothetical protein APF76_07985 [Desulfitibacter sp. BRH_c19]|nr:MAG: hypothetical protein APF76_07985 [Desulfitibacter sp. BRH_c19]